MLTNHFISLSEEPKQVLIYSTLLQDWLETSKAELCEDYKFPQVIIPCPEFDDAKRFDIICNMLRVSIMSEEPASPISTRVVALDNKIQSMLFFEVNGDIVEGPPKAAMEAFGMKEFMMLKLVFGSDDEAEDIAICVVSKSKLHGFELR